MWSVHVDTDGYLMDEGPGVLLGDGGGEDGQDLVEVHTAVLVQGAGVPHVTSHGHAWLLHSLLATAAGLMMSDDDETLNNRDGLDSVVMFGMAAARGGSGPGSATDWD